MRKIKIFICILLCLCLLGCTKKTYKVERGEYELTYKTGYYASEINEDKDALYVIYSHKGIGDDTKWGGEDDDIIPNRYATDNDLQGRYLDTFWDENGNPLGFNLKTTELDKFNVDIYDIKTGKKLKTIDVKSIFDNDDNIKPDKPYKAIALEYDGKPYIMVWSEKTSEDIENGYEDRLKSVFINIEDETYFEDWARDVSERRSKGERITAVDKWDIFNEILLKQNSLYSYITVSSSSVWEGFTDVYVYDIDRIPKESKSLYELFPKLRENLDKLMAKGEKAKVTFMLSDSISDKELADMFFENVEDISFDGVIVDGRHSVDGLPHKINNFDDFKKYIEPEDMERSRYNPIPDNR
ncbi:hypothetical protein [Lachnoanaerobaculum gingivalis]|uniref:hypothetical protein n=1 Tax=Lachnoanaerobaculum gingivalis TaxID=2490855 RepID=UPI0024A6AF45|nr:hypothetical protein [Lachnoanaerobaculum gingivalis]WHE87802.1 hypothetical protein QJR73_01990 [Lachnoanaerobaculum gingivalis]